MDPLFTSTLNVNNNDFQNQETGEINENSTYNDNYINSLMDNLDDYVIGLEFGPNVQMQESAEQFVDFLDGVRASSEQFQPITTDVLVHENQSQMQHSRETSNRDIELIQSVRLDDAWKNLVKTLRTNEKRLTRRNVPRFMVFYNHNTLCYINCTLHMLLNAPVFLRLTLRLQKIHETNSSNLQLIQNTQAKWDIFGALLQIIKIAFEDNENDDVDILLLQSFHDIYKKLYSHMNDWFEQNPNTFYIHLMDILKLVASEMNQIESYSKAFEITSSLSIDDSEPAVEKEYVIRGLSNNCDFLRHINTYYTGTVVEDDNGHAIKRIYDSLPQQLFAIAERQQNTINVSYPYPTEFITSRTQRYLFTSAICTAVSLDCDQYIVVVRRQDCVYLLDSHCIIDRFHIDYLPVYFKTVHVQALLYTEIDSLCEYVCTFEDPLSGIRAGKPYHETSGYCKTKQLATSIQSNASIAPIDVPLVIIRHPILSTFRYYMHSDFLRNNIRNEIPILNDCLDQNPLYFWPRSMLVGFSIECTLLLKDPNEKFYLSPFEFVRNELSGKKFENPTYFDIEQDNTSNDEWFPLKITISRSKQQALQGKDELQDNDICQLIGYPDGKIERIDAEKLLSFTDDKDKKKTSRRRLNNNSRKVTPFRLSKVIDLNTVYLAFRRARYLSIENKYLPDSDPIFYSNAFKPVASSVKKCQYHYSSDLLKITELSPIRVALSSETDTCTISLSYEIPEMYKCTSLKDKYMKITLLTGSNEEPRIHPIYQILDKQNRISSMTFYVNEYSSTLMIIIVKRTMNELQKDPKLHQTLNNPSTSKRTTPTITQDSLQRIFTTPSMTSFRIQLELCHLSNNNLIIYPKSAVISTTITDGSASQERQSLPQRLEIDNANYNDILITDPSLHVKRSFDEEIYDPSDISSMKCQKSM